MTEQDKKVKYEELKKDIEFGRRLEAAESPEAIIALLAAEGVTVDPEDAKEVYEFLREPGELSDEMLDEVTGGFSIGLTVGACCALYGLIYGTAYGIWKTYNKK